jgi:hypothetical protein
LKKLLAGPKEAQNSEIKFDIEFTDGTASANGAFATSKGGVPGFSKGRTVPPLSEIHYLL